MRLFEHFPQGGKEKCPVCGTEDDRPCFLMPIDGTSDGQICEAVPTHADCISGRLDQLRFSRLFCAIYMKCGREVAR